MRRSLVASFFLFVGGFVCAACAPAGAGEGKGEGEGEEGEGEGEDVEFVVDSAGFVDGGALDVAYTCDGANVSPPLSWSGAPSGTAGFALVLTDRSIGLVHSTLWDIAADATALPEDVDHDFSPADVDGAHQSFAYDGVTRGYLGPCPPEQHTYEFRLSAVDTRPLALDEALDEDSSAEDVVAAIDAAAIASVTMTVTYTP